MIDQVRLEWDYELKPTLIDGAHEHDVVDVALEACPMVVSVKAAADEAGYETEIAYTWNHEGECTMAVWVPADAIVSAFTIFFTGELQPDSVELDDISEWADWERARTAIAAVSSVSVHDSRWSMRPSSAPK
jgi:hypothetical protein